MMKIKAILCGALAGLVLVAGAVRAEWNWSFDSNAQGWTVADLHTFGPYHPPLRLYSLSHGTVGGCPGGYVYRADPSVNTFAFNLPLEALPEGVQLAGGRLEFCLRSTQQNWTSEAFVILGSPVATLLAAIPVPASTWTPYGLDLLPANFVVEGGGAVNQALLESVFAGLEGFYIVAEYGTGTETTYLDTVRLRQACGPLAAPQVTAQVVGDSLLTQVQLDWPAVAGTYRYKVYQSDLSWQTSVLLGATTGLQWLVTPPAEGKAAFRVVASCD
jgi:hypothetical protein